MLRHHNVPVNKAPVPAPDSLKFLLKNLPFCSGVEKSHPVVTTEGDEMKTLLVLVAPWLGHDDCRNCTPIL